MSLTMLSMCRMCVPCCVEPAQNLISALQQAEEDTALPTDTAYMDVMHILSGALLLSFPCSHRAGISEEDGAILAQARGLLEWHQRHPFCSKVPATPHAFNLGAFIAWALTPLPSAAGRRRCCRAV